MSDTAHDLLTGAFVGTLGPLFWWVSRSLLLWAFRMISPRAERWVNVPLFQAAGQLFPRGHWMNRPIFSLIRAGFLALVGRGARRLGWQRAADSVTTTKDRQ